MSTWKPRNGQFVEFLPWQEIPGAWTLPDGYIVGIWRDAEWLRDAHGAVVLVPVRIVPLDDRGHDVRVRNGNATDERLYLRPADVRAARPLLDRDHLPPGRIVDPGWEPQP